MSLEVAQALGGSGHRVEIVSCDSMAVYRGFEVLAAKPSPEERARVPHHLLDVADTTDDFTVVSYRELARGAIADIASRECVPMLVGGSGLYFRAVVDDLEFAPTSPEVRERLSKEDPDELYERLRAEDPAGAEQLDPRNVRRVIRAVEVLELTGRPPSELRGDWGRRESRYPLTALGLEWSREMLFTRVDERVREQVANGVVEEVRRASERGLSKTSAQALGVKEIGAYLDGSANLDDAAAALVKNTKAFIRRQVSWFKADPRIEWIDAGELGWEGAREAMVEGFAAALAGPAIEDEPLGRPSVG